jgi:hypothetical protein
VVEEDQLVFGEKNRSPEVETLEVMKLPTGGEIEHHGPRTTIRI